MGLTGDPMLIMSREDRSSPATPRGAGRKPAGLRPGRDVRRVLRTGRKTAGERMLLYVLPQEGPVRAAFVASRRIGGAVVRNRARRQMKEAWRSLLPTVTDGFDVVFAARPGLPGATTRDLGREMKELLEQSGVVRG